ncbi:Magnesium transporter NIPA2 [Aphelenchoides fujianensis]|nr:Magnesium transporter NIPA2 [Aphelenchoides fujianensis]
MHRVKRHRLMSGPADLPLHSWTQRSAQEATPSALAKPHQQPKGAPLRVARDAGFGQSIDEHLGQHVNENQQSQENLGQNEHPHLGQGENEHLGQGVDEHLGQNVDEHHLGQRLKNRKSSAKMSDDDSSTLTLPGSESKINLVDFYVGLGLAVSSSIFIGSSFIIKKKALIKLASVGEACNFAAYAFAPASLVTPLGALSVLVTAILSSRLLKERLNLLGKIGCAICLLGSTMIVIHSPKEEEVSTMEDLADKMKDAVFILYVVAVILVTLAIIVYVAPRYGRSNILVFIAVCSLIGSLSVISVKGLGLAIKETISGHQQLSNLLTWFWLLSVIACVSVQLIYLNKSLDIYNTSMVTPIYYVFFTTFVIIASSILYKEWSCLGASDVIGNVIGFLTTIIGIFQMQLFRDVDIPLRRFRVLMHNQALSVNQLDLMDSTASLVDYYDQTWRDERECERQRRLERDPRLPLEESADGRRLKSPANSHRSSGPLMSTPAYKLKYFDLRASAEPIRLLFHYSRTPFQDERIARENWPGEKPKTPCWRSTGSRSPKSYAILRHLAKQFQLAGKDAWEEASLDETLELYREFTDATAPYFRLLVRDDLRKEKFLPGIEKYAPLLEKRLKESGSGFFGKSGVSYVDFVIAEGTDTMHGQEKELLEQKYPHSKKVHSLPELGEYLATRKQSPI